LDDPEGHEHRHAGRGAARRRRRREDRDPEQEPELARIALGQATEEDEQRGVDDRVGVEHPREVPEPALVQVGGHVRQRDVHDEEVEAGEHDSGADDEQHEPGRSVRTPSDPANLT
jgi:hypothetical protein